MTICVLFFSSRRRHTRWTGDWSSDVCSSDLADGTYPLARQVYLYFAPDTPTGNPRTLPPALREFIRYILSAQGQEIGRASCRERVEVPLEGLPRRQASHQGRAHRYERGSAGH